MKNFDESFINSSKADMEKIGGHISDLMWSRKMYTDFNEIIKNNPKIDTPNAFYDFVKIGYVSDIVLSICRQIDKDERALSLMNLLKRIFNGSEKITKEWFSDQYKDTVLNEEFGEAAFKEHFGDMDFIDPSIVSADIGSLIFYTKEIKKYRNKRIAHFENGKVVFDKDFNFDTFNKAIEVIDVIAKKYYLLLFQKGYGTFEPTDHTRYQSIFYEPWIIK